MLGDRIFSLTFVGRSMRVLRCWSYGGILKLNDRSGGASVEFFGRGQRIGQRTGDAICKSVHSLKFAVFYANSNFYKYN